MSIIEYHSLGDEWAWLSTRSVNFSPAGALRILSFINSQQSLNKYIPYFYDFNYQNSTNYYMGSSLFYLFSEPGFYDLANNTLIAPNLFNWVEKYSFDNNYPLNQYAIDTLVSILTGIPDLSGFLTSLEGITPENCFEYREKIIDMYKARYIFLQSLSQVIPDEENQP